MNETGASGFGGPGERIPADAPSGSDQLDSWKEIAAYLRRDESTVRRWEKAGLPVHRHRHKSRAAVFAYKAELDAWWKQDGSAAAGGPPDPVRRSSELPGGTITRTALFPGVAVTIVLAMALLGARLLFFPASVASAARPLMPSPFVSLEGEVGYPAFAPDGKHLAFTWANSETPNSSIYVKAADGNAPVRLTSPKAVSDLAPKWSPDGSQIAFLRLSETEGGIFSVPVLGGPVRELLELRPDRYYDLDYSPDGKAIAFAQRTSSRDPYAIWLLSLADGARSQLTFPPRDSFGETKFAFSPDGTALAFLRHESEPPVISLEVVKLNQPGSPRTLAAYSEWIGELSWSADSDSIIVAGYREGIRSLWRVFLKDGPNGREQEIPGAGTDAYFPAVSRSGNELAFVREVSDSDLWRAELVSPDGPAKTPVPVMSSKRVEGAPRFSPDGKRIAFQSYRSGVPQIWVSDPDGSNAVQVTDIKSAKPEMPAWSPDGSSIAYADGGSQVINASGGPPRTLFADGKPFDGPSWSRDGQRIYFWRKDRGGEAQIWQVPSAGGVETQVTTHGGVSSMESADGKSLYFTKLREPGIWKMPVGGGEETLVLAAMRPQLPGYWALVDDGIYYLDADRPSEPTIDFYRFATRQSKRVVRIDGQADEWFGGLTVSPDRRWIVFSQRQYLSFEILLAKDFR